MISGAKVTLTELRREDSDSLLSWINDPETVKFNATYAPVHEPSHAAWFERVTTDRSRIVFGIRRITDPTICGVVQLVDIHPVHRRAELTIRIGTEADRGQGIGSEAIGLVVNFAFDHLNLQRVWLRVFSNNLRAIRAYEKMGMTIEGKMRRSAYVDGQWIDELIMAIIRDA